MSAARALGAIYLATASVFGLAIAFNQHPDWKATAGVAGEHLAVFARAHVVGPAARVGRRELVALFNAIDPPQRLAREPLAPAAAPAPVEHLAARRSPPVVARADTSNIERQITIDSLLAEKSAAAPRLSEPPHRAVANNDLVEAPPPSVSEAPAPDAQPAPTVVATARPPVMRTPALTLAPTAPPAPQLPQANAPAPLSAPSAGELARVVEHLKQNLTGEMLASFELFLYVSKADEGPLAQRMYVFDKDANGDLTLKYDWPVSTGRERVEFNASGTRLPTFTPEGYYELDPHRLYQHYTSSQWGQPMPYSMFFNWIKNGEKTGLAIHAATGSDVAMLGHRASAGCIHIAPEHARVLFSLIRDHYRGLAPRFAYDRRTGTMSNDGILVHDPDGRVQMAQGYKVLVFIENYGGEGNVVAALY